MTVTLMNDDSRRNTSTTTREPTGKQSRRRARSQPESDGGPRSVADLLAALGEQGIAELPTTAPQERIESQLHDQLPIDAEDDLSGVEGEASPSLVRIVESLLFAAPGPLGVRDIRKVLQDPSSRQVQLALKHIHVEWENRGVMLAQVAGGFQFRTHADNAGWVQKLLAAKPARLSRPQLETLAMIAYRQPITRVEIDHLRGVDTGAVIKVLLERELIEIVGRREEPGRPIVYGTTVKFLEFFNLRSLRELPPLQEVRALSSETLRAHGSAAGLRELEALGQEALSLAVDEPEQTGDGTDSAGS